jgi:hypothetical protein
MILCRLCLYASLAAGLAACASPPPPPRFAEIRFDQEPPIRLEVGRIEIVDLFQPSFRPPEVEHEFPVPPAHALEALCRDRFQAAAPGSANFARFTIVDASVRETELPRTEGIEGAFTIDQTWRYDGRVAVRLEIIDARGSTVRTVAAEAVRNTTEAEDISPDERDRAWYEMSRDLVQSLDQELERQIDATLYPYES